LAIIANFPGIEHYTPFVSYMYSVATATAYAQTYIANLLSNVSYTQSLGCPSHFHSTAELVSRASLPYSGLRDYIAECGRRYGILISTSGGHIN